MTLAPSQPRRLAIPCPIPWPAPVTIATLPFEPRMSAPRSSLYRPYAWLDAEGEGNRRVAIGWGTPGFCGGTCAWGAGFYGWIGELCAGFCGFPHLRTVRLSGDMGHPVSVGG